MKTNPNAPANVVDGIYGSDAMNSDNTGLTKREHFAAMAMQGYMSYEFAGHQDPHGVAAYAVQCADALIEALNKEVQP